MQLFHKKFQCILYCLVMCSQTQSFRFQATLSTGGLVLWRTQIASAQGFSSCRSARMNGVWIHMAATSFNNTDLAFGPRDATAHLPVFLHLRTTNFPGPDSITRREQAQQRHLERKATKHERRQCRRRLTQPQASRCTGTAVAGKHSVCSLHDVTALSGVSGCLDLCMLSTWDR